MMHVIIQSKTLEVTQALRNYVQKQVKKLARRGKKIEKVTVVLDSVKKKKNDSSAKTVQFHIELPGKNLTVRKQAHDMYVAIVDAAESTARSLRKKKEKQVDRKRKAISLGML